MTNVTTRHMLITQAGHHRQPRNAGGFQDLGAGNSFTSSDDTEEVSALDLPNIAFLFWSITDGTTGSTSLVEDLTYPVYGSNLVVTGWYVAVGGTGPGGPGFLIDAFSARAGWFIDDDFVEVTSDASLTDQANVAGFIPTQLGQAAQAFASVDAEPFDRWMGASSAADRDAKFDQGDTGFAIAFYEDEKGDPLNAGRLNIPAATWLLLLGGITKGGGGIQIGPSGGGGPVGPEGLRRLAAGLALHQLAAEFDGQLRVQLQRLARADVAKTNAAIARLSKKRPG